jgi:hypothetical protein
LRGTPGSLPKQAGDCQMELLITWTDPFLTPFLLGLTPFRVIKLLAGSRETTPAFNFHGISRIMVSM